MKEYFENRPTFVEVMYIQVMFHLYTSDQAFQNMLGVYLVNSYGMFFCEFFSLFHITVALVVDVVYFLILCCSARCSDRNCGCLSQLLCYSHEYF